MPRGSAYAAPSDDMVENTSERMKEKMPFKTSRSKHKRAKKRSKKGRY